MIDPGASFYRSALVNQMEISPELLATYITASQEYKKLITNSCVSRKPIEFYLKHTFQNSSLAEEYNFYNESNLLKLKAFFETLLSEINKNALSYAPISSPESENNEEGAKNNEIKDRDLKIINGQLNELKKSLKHFLNCLHLITQAESKYYEGVEKGNIFFKIDHQKFKLNKQALFQESENLITFTNNLIHILESLDFAINNIMTNQENFTQTTDRHERKLNMVKEDKQMQTEGDEDREYDERPPYITKDILKPPVISKENTNYYGGWNENNYPSVESSQHHNVSSLKRTDTLETGQRSSPLKEDGDKRYGQLMQVIKSLEMQLETKDDNLKQVKKNLLKEIQDSNNLRLQLKKMIEENMYTKQKLDDALELNDEFERMLAENKEHVQEELELSREEVVQLESRYEDEIKFLAHKNTELQKENELLKQSNMELKMQNLVLNQSLLDGEFIDYKKGNPHS